MQASCSCKRIEYSITLETEIGCKYATVAFRKEDGLKTSGRLVYEVTTKKINKVRSADSFSRSISYKILDEGDEDSIDTPKLRDDVLIRLRTCLVIDDESNRKQVIFSLGDPPSNGKNLEDSFEKVKLSNAELPLAVEAVILKVGKRP